MYYREKDHLFQLRVPWYVKDIPRKQEIKGMTDIRYLRETGEKEIKGMTDIRYLRETGELSNGPFMFVTVTILLF